MMKTKKMLHEVMNLAWQFVRTNGLGMSEALKLAWANLRLRNEMKNRIVHFRFIRVDGSVREAVGTLDSRLMPPLKDKAEGTRSNAVQVYYDLERGGFRCYRKANLISVA